MANWGRLGSRGRVEDRRGLGPAAVGGIGVTGVVLLMLFNFLAGGDIDDALLQLQNKPIQEQQIDTTVFEGEDEYEVFASTVLGSNNEMWSQVFQHSNKEYNPPKLVLFRTATESSCGVATSDVGPHYCPIDKTIYLDETFFAELQTRFGARGGDVAEAYVIAHEVAHHAQNELGIMSEIMDKQQSNQSLANELSVQLELQADCFAGLWANSIKDLEVFEPNEIYEAMDAAASVGDDRIQQKVTGYINPESWTHGSSEQRVEAFNKGYNAGNLSSCNLVL